MNIDLAGTLAVGLGTSGDVALMDNGRWEVDGTWANETLAWQGAFEGSATVTVGSPSSFGDRRFELANGALVTLSARADKHLAAYPVGSALVSLSYACDTFARIGVNGAFAVSMGSVVDKLLRAFPSEVVAVTVLPTGEVIGAYARVAEVTTTLIMQGTGYGLPWDKPEIPRPDAWQGEAPGSDSFVEAPPANSAWTPQDSLAAAAWPSDTSKTSTWN